MKEFVYEIKDELGIHARPAGLLVKEAAKYESSTELECDGKKADGKKIFSVMSLGAKHNSKIKVKITGADEEEAARSLRLFFEKNL